LPGLAADAAKMLRPVATWPIERQIFRRLKRTICASFEGPLAYTYRQVSPRCAGLSSGLNLGDERFSLLPSDRYAITERNPYAACANPPRFDLGWAVLFHLSALLPGVTLHQNLKGRPALQEVRAFLFEVGELTSALRRRILRHRGRCERGGG
jgi:hypothetical protein